MPWVPPSVRPAIAPRASAVKRPAGSPVLSKGACDSLSPPGPQVPTCSREMPLAVAFSAAAGMLVCDQWNLRTLYTEPTGRPGFLPTPMRHKARRIRSPPECAIECAAERPLLPVPRPKQKQAPVEVKPETSDFETRYLAAHGAFERNGRLPIRCCDAS